MQKEAGHHGLDMGAKPLEQVESVSDTALWVAHLRALESARPDALFNDRFAGLLAGQRGAQLSKSLGRESAVWVLTVRTWLLDRIIPRLVTEARIDTVLNLAAGLDTRPYRLELPPDLRWIEVDFEPILSYKERKLAGETPVCRLEREAVDLTDAATRNGLFDRVARSSSRVLVITEGLLIYLTDDDVRSLAGALHDRSQFVLWVADYSSPITKFIIQRRMGRKLESGDAALHFAPADGKRYFAGLGWRERERHPFVEVAAQLGRQLKGMETLRAIGRLVPPVGEALRRLKLISVMERA